MIVEYTLYTIGASQQEAVEHAYGEAAEALCASLHCERYELTRCSEDPAQYVLCIEWDSAMGHLGGFRKSPEFRAFLGFVQPFFKDIEEMRHYESTGIDGKGDAQPRQLTNVVVLPRPFDASTRRPRSRNRR